MIIYIKNLLLMLGFMVTVHTCTSTSINTDLACASMRWSVRGTTVSLTVEQDTLQNELKDTWSSQLIPHICFISLYPSQIPSNWFWIVIFNLNKLPLLTVKVHCATQFSYRANDRKGAEGGEKNQTSKQTKNSQNHLCLMKWRHERIY